MSRVRLEDLCEECLEEHKDCTCSSELELDEEELDSDYKEEFCELCQRMGDDCLCFEQDLREEFVEAII